MTKSDSHILLTGRVSAVSKIKSMGVKRKKTPAKHKSLLTYRP